MMKERNEGKLSSLTALLLFVIFAVCVLFVLLTGADIYQRLVLQNQRNYDSRTAAQYLTTKIRQSDRLDCLEVREKEGTDALVIEETIEGVKYETWIYCREGYICELFTIAGSEISLADGVEVLAAEALTFCLQETAVQAAVTDPEGNVQSLQVSLRSGKEFGP